MKIGILVGGGDAPGLNAAIKAAVTKANALGFETIGIKNGWAGLLNLDTQSLTPDNVEEIHSRGGVILYTSRTNPFKIENGPKKVINNIKKLRLHALLVMGGEDTLSVAQKLYEMRTPIVAIPKTIDNDLSGTDYSIGFDTAVAIATDAIDRLRTTAEAHHRIVIVEVMGRNTGWIALYAGLAGGANLTLIPEFPLGLSQIYDVLKKREKNGKAYSIIVVAEGAKVFKEKEQIVMASEDKDEFGHPRLGGISRVLEGLIQENTGLEARSVILGHLQRGGPPTAFDRILAMRLGTKAMELVLDRRWGEMASFQACDVVSAPLKDALKERKCVPQELYEVAKTFFR
ncbi:MAG TPA: ATP-dependent 6-phosphofructokinase [Candidatus Bathyarchaeia archaeon]|nr:ATP-dependent 6-phosphofructokinase [Candidatus Bathyarchaeia archaeon]